MNAAESDLGFGAITGQMVPDRYMERVTVAPGTMIEIASDGYPSLRGSLGATEAALRDLLRIDPLCIKENKGAKGMASDRRSYDDRAYVRFRVQ